MKKQLIVLILSAYSYNFTYAMETFTGTDVEFHYTFNGNYSAQYKQKTVLSLAEGKQLYQFKADIEGLANHLKRNIANLIAEYAYVVCAFPKEGPTFKDTISITVAKIALDEYFINTKHQPSFKIKELLSKEEEAGLAEFKSRLNAVILAEQAPNLEDTLTKHNNLILCLKDGPAIELDIEIFMQRQKSIEQ